MTPTDWRHKLLDLPTKQHKIPAKEKKKKNSRQRSEKEEKFSPKKTDKR